MGYELPRGLTDSHSDSDTAAAAEQQNEQNSSDREGSVAKGLIFGGGASWESWYVHPWVAGGVTGYDSCVCEEDDAGQSENNYNADSGEPDNETGQAAKGVHEDERDDDGCS